MTEFCIYNDFGEISHDHLPTIPRERVDMSVYEDDGGMGAAEDFAAKQLMSHGMSVVLGWVSAGDFSFDALDMYIQGVADLDGDGEVQEGGDEESYYNEMFSAVADAMCEIGADESDVAKFIGDEDDDTGLIIGTTLSDKIGAMESSDDDIISNHVLGLGVEPIMESMVKRIRGGVVTWGKKKLRRRTQMSSAQRTGLKKARLKAHSAIATRNRTHSMKIRKSRGM
jgi:hypothetical protein